MRVVCRHGHFAFYPQTSEDVGRFTSFYRAELFREDDYYTFASLVGLPRYSIAGAPYGSLVALTTFEGRHAWEVMRENGFVFDLTTKLLMPKAAVIGLADISRSSYYYLKQNALIQPGARTRLAQQVISYDGDLEIRTQLLKIRSYDVG